MDSKLILACAALSATLWLVLGCGWLHARRRIHFLEAQLENASNAHIAHESLLLEHSRLGHLKDEFISNVSHELRTPLTSIRGALGLLSAGILGTVDAKAHNLLRVALTNTDRLIRLINDILDLERMASGQAPLSIRRCSLRDLALLSIETMTPMAEAAKVTLDLILNASPDVVYFDGDSDRMLQVLTNLLSNAIKFSPEHSTVEVRIEADTEAVLLRISDQGRGIPPDKLDTIFDRFSQVEAADARQKGGTGLGLAICRTIVQQHNGSIWAESNAQQQRGPGASLLVSLPRLSRIKDPIPNAGGTLTMIATPPDASVIVCDDDPGIRTVVGEKLRRHGYRILEAEDGEHAIELAINNQVDAILLDLYMPGLDGWKTLARLKQSPSTSSIPVIVLSVLRPSEEPARNGFDVTASAQGWVQKPFNEHLLLAELARVLSTSQVEELVLSGARQ